jgi:hypothetical protein
MDAAARMHNWTAQEWAQWISDAMDQVSRAERKSVAFPYLYGLSREHTIKDVLVLTQQETHDYWHECEMAKLVGFTD